MTQDRDPPRAKAAKAGKADRQARRAQALRDNLRKRKEQARQRARRLVATEEPR